jgi:hypothetical protein
MPPPAIRVGLVSNVERLFSHLHKHFHTLC